MNYYLAIDIGASSGRAIIGYKEDGIIKTDEVYRFSNGLKEENEHLVWDLRQLFFEVVSGIEKAFRKYPRIESLSIDTWGCDYVLLYDNDVVMPIYSYRDNRTKKAIEEVYKLIDSDTLYKHTGCQFQPFNTIFQLYDDKIYGRLKKANNMLMIPEYLIWKLTGVKTREFTNATTTGLVNVDTLEFDGEIIDILNFPKSLFPKLDKPGKVLGYLTPEIESRVNGNLKVVLCATHDTASAVEGIDMDGNYPYISSGTWSLLGVKTDKPINDLNSKKANYSNEGGINYNRYQKNIMGMWIINRLKEELSPELDFNSIINLAKESNNEEIVNVNEDEFLSPVSMKDVFDFKTDNKLNTIGDYYSCAYKSLAYSYKVGLEELEANTNKTYSKLYIVGGGAKNDYLNNLTKEYTNKEVIALPIEATAVGNLKVQIKQHEGEQI